jgi:hypothetical protein
MRKSFISEVLVTAVCAGTAVFRFKARFDARNKVVTEKTKNFLHLGIPVVYGGYRLGYLAVKKFLSCLCFKYVACIYIYACTCQQNVGVNL